MFKNQPNLVTESSVHPSLNPKCHHEIIHKKLSLKVEYPPFYKDVIWNYKIAHIPSINRAVDIFNLGNSFESKDVHEQFHFFNKTILNIFYNYIPNDTFKHQNKKKKNSNNNKMYSFFER